MLSYEPVCIYTYILIYENCFHAEKKDGARPMNYDGNVAWRIGFLAIACYSNNQHSAV